MAEEKKDPIRAKVILEVLGKPKDHVQKTIKLLVEKIKEDPDISILHETYAKVEPKEKSLFTTYVELEMVLKNIPTLIGFCFDFMPSSVDIDKPEELTLKNREISSIVNELQAKLHTVDMVAKSLRAERDLLKKNLNTMMQNSIAILINVGKNTVDDLEKFSGMDKKILEPFLEQQVKAGMLIKENNKYSINRKKE